MFTTLQQQCPRGSQTSSMINLFIQLAFLTLYLQVQTWILKEHANGFYGSQSHNFLWETYLHRINSF